MKPEELSDLELLNAWTGHGDRTAVGELVRRHIGFVQAVARRCVGADSHLAEDVTQAVFILLLRKAHRIKSEAAMTSWLYTTTHYAAANATKMIRRQRHREMQRALAAGETMLEAREERMVEEQELQMLLQEAMDHLPRGERLCVMMSYMQEKTHGQVAAAMGLSPDAARKRIYRGVERMREFLLSRGVAVPAGAVLAGVVTKSATASAAFIESTANVAVLAQGPGAATTAAIIAKGATTMLLTNKLKVAAAVALAATLVGVAAGRTLSLLAGTPARVPVAAAPAAPGVTGSSVDLGDGLKVEFVGIAEMGSNQWHDFAGKAIGPQKAPEMRARLSIPPTHQALIRLTAPHDAAARVVVSGVAGFGLSRGPDEYLTTFNVIDGNKSVDLTVSVADGPWQDVIRTRGPVSGVMSMVQDSTGVIFFEPVDKGAQSLISVAVSQAQPPGQADQWRLVCLDKSGGVHEGKPTGGGGTPTMIGQQCLFDLSTKQIGALIIQTRPYQKTVVAKHLPLAIGGAPAEIVADQANHSSLP